MGAMEVGQKLVEMVNKGEEEAFVNQYYVDSIVSIEGGEDTEEMPSRLEGMAAVRGKAEWWESNNEVHSTTASGPYVGHRKDQFIIRFVMDITPKGGERMQMDEVGLYTVKDDKIVQEEFLYLMG